jgi:hypothetical protein
MSTTVKTGRVGLDLVLTSDRAAAFEQTPENLVRGILDGLAVAILEELSSQFGAATDIDLESPRTYAQASYTRHDGASLALHIPVRPDEATAVSEFARQRWNAHLADVRTDLERRSLR